MKIELRAEKPVTDASIKADTGKTFKDWFAIIDAFGGIAKGRRDIGKHLYEVHKLDPWWATTVNIACEAANGIVEKDGRPKGYTICATKSIKASPTQCFDAFSTARALDDWLGPLHKLDFKDGGELSNGDGNKATLRKINPGKVIRLVWQAPAEAADTPVEIKFAPSGAKTTVMVTHDRLQDRETADGFRRAWGEALDRLKAKLEG